MSGNHTPTPWKVVQKPNFENGYIYTSIQPVTPDPETMRHMLMVSGEYYVCDMIHTPIEWKAAKHKQNAEFIVTAVNSHASLLAEVEKLRAALEFYADPKTYEPHPHGPAFDRRDVSYVARAALSGSKE